MTENVHRVNKATNNREQFKNELKMFVNQKLFDKKLISENMYWTAKDTLLKQAS